MFWEITNNMSEMLRVDLMRHKISVCTLSVFSVTYEGTHEQKVLHENFSKHLVDKLTVLTFYTMIGKKLKKFTYSTLRLSPKEKL